MAYLVRDARSRSAYWYGVYLVISPGGQRRWVRKSTKKRKRSEAKEILDAWQKTADRAAAGNLDQARIREIVLESVERVTGKRTDSPTVSEWLERWIRTERWQQVRDCPVKSATVPAEFYRSLIRVRCWCEAISKMSQRCDKTTIRTKKAMLIRYTAARKTT
jgi:hypothetical protein